MRKVKYFESGKGKQEYEWLRDNAYEFGFCQVYSEKGMERKYGYEEEKWHWSYIQSHQNSHSILKGIWRQRTSMVLMVRMRFLLAKC